MKKFTYLICIILLLHSGEIFAGNGQANTTGNWTNPSTWLINGTARVPTCGDTVLIPAGYTVTVNTQIDLSTCSTPMYIIVDGTFSFTNGNKLDLSCGSIVRINTGGLLKKATAGGGNSTLISICGTTEWNAGMGDLPGPVTLGSGLPISLLTFQAKPEGKKVELYWATATEINNDHFTIERSAEILDFVPVVQIPGAGNSDRTLYYETTDYSPMEGLSYYRLKQTDFDGKFTYSNAVAVYFSDKDRFDIVSVSADQYKNFTLLFQDKTNENCHLAILNLLGTKVFEMDIRAERGTNKEMITLPELAQGMYFVTLSNPYASLSRKFYKP